MITKIISWCIDGIVYIMDRFDALKKSKFWIPKAISNNKMKRVRAERIKRRKRYKFLQEY